MEVGAKGVGYDTGLARKGLRHDIQPRLLFLNLTSIL